MHSLNHAVMGNAVAAERAGRPMVRAVQPGAPSARPVPRCAPARPTPPGRFARRLDREMARRAVA